MRERPILFNADMVSAVLDGRKTQTRRIIQERHLYSGGRTAGNWPVHMPEGEEGEKARLWAESNSPFGAVGDRLWVRESFYEHGHWQGGGYDPEDSYFVSDKQVLYPADGIQRPSERKREDFWRSRPSIHMPRWASRITLEITGVRVERLRDLSEEDAKSEGVIPPAGGVLPGWEHRINFRDLWMSIYGADNWEANPWVWVVEFKRLEVE
ncbi:hypothetical protein WKG92_07320 [Pantoea agglomerans]|uniref:hypothetical protein n=1 Tax=Enterobacter agglomerans TaxID=549 RepID=UPI003C7E36A7